MRARDRSDGLSKEGCGRVNALKITNSPYCYTIEANYHTGKIINEIPQLGHEDIFMSNSSELYRMGSPHYNPDVLSDLGRGLAITFLDMVEANPLSRVPISIYKNMLNIK